MYNFEVVIKEQAAIILNFVIIKYCHGVVFVTTSAFFSCFNFWEKAQTRFWFRAILC